jgi:hypothetical protein
MQQQVTCKKFNAQCVFLSARATSCDYAPRNKCITCARPTRAQSQNTVAQRINIYLATPERERERKADLPAGAPGRRVLCGESQDAAFYYADEFTADPHTAAARGVL